jgi:hypothetical protein
MGIFNFIDPPRINVRYKKLHQRPIDVDNDDAQQ